MAATLSSRRSDARRSSSSSHVPACKRSHCGSETEGCGEIYGLRSSTPLSSRSSLPPLYPLCPLCPPSRLSHLSRLSRMSRLSPLSPLSPFSPLSLLSPRSLLSSRPSRPSRPSLSSLSSHLSHISALSLLSLRPGGVGWEGTRREKGGRSKGGVHRKEAALCFYHDRSGTGRGAHHVF